MVDGKNQIVGSDVELAKAIAKELGVEVEFSPMSFDNVLASLDSGKADLAISGISKTEERSQVYDFSIPYYTSKNKVIVRKSELTNYQSVKDLAQKKVGAQKGSIQETLAKETLQNASLVSLPKNGNLITDLKSGQLDAVIFEEPVAKGFVENNSDLAIAEFDFDNDKEDSYAVAMKKYGLQRGVDGSEARHVSTQQYYRDIKRQTEELKTEVVELQERKETAREELERAKKEIQTERLKGAATTAAANIAESVGSDRKSTRLNSSHVKRSRMPSSA